MSSVIYPNITLKIENHIPMVILENSEDTNKLINQGSETLSEVILNLASDLDLHNKELQLQEEQLEHLLNLARESDENYFEVDDLGAVKEENIQLYATLKKILNRELEKVEYYNDFDFNDEVKQELIKNQKSDIFATILDLLYLMLVAQTVLAASELGITSIYLDDKHKNTRLLEKMGRELQELNIDLLLKD